MKEIIVIGDIHGCFDTFMELLKKIPEGDQIVLVGDLEDRGPKSMQVIQYVMDHPEILCVKANHEEMMITDQDGTTKYPGSWQANGGNETLLSYRKDYNSKFDQETLDKHLAWMKKLPLYLEFPDTYLIGNDTDHGRKRHLVVSHASIGSTWKFRDPSHKRHHYFINDAMWNRNPPYDVKDIYNIHGHTPCYMEPRIKSFYSNIDTGCVYNRTGYGKLSALRFPSLELIQQRNVDSDFKKL